MVTKRKVTKKKTANTSASRKSTATAAKSVSTSVPKKKGVAARRKSAVSSNILSLDGSIVISNVLEWHGKMVAAISGQDELVLDGGEIEQIDGSGLQLLVALMKEAAMSKTNISWKSASDVLCRNAAQLGLTEILSLDKLSGVA